MDWFRIKSACFLRPESLSWEDYIREEYEFLSTSIAHTLIIYRHFYLKGRL
jgi:hypothetical protein